MNTDTHTDTPEAESGPSISVVIAAYNEEHTIHPLVERLAQALSGRPFEILFVNDGSSDGTLERIREAAGRDGRVRFVSLTRNFGKTAALAAGFLRARGDLVVTLDADLQDLPEELPMLLERLEERGLDVVVGWKYPRRDSLGKRFVSKIFNGMVHAMGAPPVHDANCGLKVMRRPVVEAIPMYGELHRFIPLLAAWKGYRVGEEKVRHEPRAHGRSKFGLERYIRAIFDIMSLGFITRYSRRPLHFIGGIGASLALVGLAILAYLSILWFLGQPIQARPLFFLGILSFITGVQTLTIGLVMEMITYYNHQPGKDSTIRETGGRGLPAPQDPVP